MAAQNPLSLRGLLLQSAEVLVALICLYALSIGPAYYVVFSFPKTDPFVWEFYAPLRWATYDKAAAHSPPLLRAYIQWWYDLAKKHHQTRPPTVSGDSK